MLFHNVTDENFLELILQNKGKIFLAAGTKWCPDTGNLIEKVMPKIFEEENLQIEFFYAEIEGRERGKKLAPLIHEALGIEGYPTIFGFVGGKLIARKLTEKWSMQEEDVRGMLETLHK